MYERVSCAFHVNCGNKGSGLKKRGHHRVIKAMQNNCNTVTSGCRYDTPADRVHDSASCCFGLFNGGQFHVTANGCSVSWLLGCR
jgi:hypothetical protein